MIAITIIIITVTGGARDLVMMRIQMRTVMPGMRPSAIVTFGPFPPSLTYRPNPPWSIPPFLSMTILLLNVRRVKIAYT